MVGNIRKIRSPRRTHLDFRTRSVSGFRTEVLIISTSYGSGEFMKWCAILVECICQPCPRYLAEQRIIGDLGVKRRTGITDHAELALPRGLSLGIVEKDKSGVTTIGVWIQERRIVNLGLQRYRPGGNRLGRWDLNHVNLGAERMPAERIQRLQKLQGGIDLRHMFTVAGRSGSFRVARRVGWDA